MAVFHHPRFYSCSGPSCGLVSSRSKPFWVALSIRVPTWSSTVTIIITSGSHTRTRTENPAPDSGIREFIVGLGGKSVSIEDVQAHNSEVLNDERPFGVIKLTLQDDNSFEWEFISLIGYTFTDSDSGTCTGTGPIADFNGPAPSASNVEVVGGRPDRDELTLRGSEQTQPPAGRGERQPS